MRHLETKHSLPTFVLTIMLVCVSVDQISKWIALDTLTPGVPVHVIGDFNFLLVRNPGAAFSIGQNFTWLFAIFQLAAVIVALFFANRVKHWVPALAVGLIGGGAGGNLMDRIFRDPGFFQGHVVDFLSFGNFAIFNLADTAISCGVGVLLLYLLFIEPRIIKQQSVEGIVQKKEVDHG